MTILMIIQTYGIPLLLALAGWWVGRKQGQGGSGGGGGGGTPGPVVPNVPLDPKGPLPANHPFILWLLAMLQQFAPPALKPSVQATAMHRDAIAKVGPHALE